MQKFNEDDLELALLGGKPIKIDNTIFSIYPITFNQIAEIGYSIYSAAIQIFCLTPESLNNLLKQEINNDIYDSLCALSIKNESIRKNILLALFLITHQKFMFDLGNTNRFGTVIDVENRNTKNVNKIKYFIVNDTFSTMQYLTRVRNGLDNSESDEGNPANEKARELIKQRNKYRHKLKEEKSDDVDITIADLISVAAIGLHIELSKIYEYDMYQLNDQINRLKIFKNYDINIQALIHGAKSEDVKLKSWICSGKSFELLNGSGRNEYDY